MIEISREDSLIFKLSNNPDFPSLHVFMGIMDKVHKESAKKGFRNMFNKDEKFFIDNFVRELKNEVNYTNG